MVRLADAGLIGGQPESSKACCTCCSVFVFGNVSSSDACAAMCSLGVVLKRTMLDAGLCGSVGRCWFDWWPDRISEGVFCMGFSSSFLNRLLSD